VNTFKNIRIINYCWSCNEPYDHTHADANERSVKCGKCGGFVVSPSGKAKMEVIPGTKCFLLQDAENHWIAANSEEEAKRCYRDTYEDDEEDYTIREMTSQEMLEIIILEDDYDPGHKSETGEVHRTVTTLLWRVPFGNPQPIRL